MEKDWKKFSKQSIYILIHADDFAINRSMIRTDHDQVRSNIRARCLQSSRLKMPMVFTDLAFNQPPFPDYLKDFEADFIRIPNDQTGNLTSQITNLKQFLTKDRSRDRYIFAGGWRDACLRYTVNQIGFRAPRLIVNETGLKGTAEATLKLAGYRDRNIKVAVDWQNVF
ncbi:MAG: hypothetical protein ACI82A_004474 [Candidatus Azotimanducaceae bacterium]|jgi:hypothetical protein